MSETTHETNGSGVSNFPRKMLFATDGSEDAALAARAAADIQTRTGAELHLVHAWQGFPLWPGLPRSAYSEQAVEEYTGLYQQKARQLMRQQAHEVRGAGADLAGTHLLEGRPAEEISGLAEELGAGLVVVGCRGLGLVKRLTVGSVSEEVVSFAPCPVLVTRGSWPPSWVIVGDDFSEEARKAGELAAGIGRLFGASVLLVRTFYPTFQLPPPGFLRQARGEENPRAWLDELLKTKEIEKVLQKRAEELEEVLGRLPQTRVTVGDAAAIMLEAAEESEQPVLVAVGNRGLGSVKRAVLGSVSTKVLRAADGPVLMAPCSGGSSQWLRNPATFE